METFDLCLIGFFFFSLFHQRAEDEALTRFLQTSLFLVASPILVKSMFLSFRSSLTLSIQVFLCLPLHLFPSTCPCKAAFGNLFSSILSTCRNHCSLLFLIFCTTVSSAPSSSLVCSCLIGLNAYKSASKEQPFERKSSLLVCRAQLCRRYKDGTHDNGD